MLKWLWVSVLVLVLDQASKLAIDAHFQLYESIPLLPNFNLTYARNTGAAFSFLAQVGGWQRWLFAGLAVVMSSIIGIWLYRLKRHETMMAWALSLVLGGAIGNLIDRVAYGYVIDFLDVFYRDWHWPVFNIADSAICVGVGLMVLESFGIGRRTAEVLE
ncbi:MULTISPECIES: signal peptidase II [Methylomonas]|uniref:Lipoprotein signal peptidase n=1 Tax=Methylomonas koyamae TaxID=702114 RepID=A0A177NLH6_9GAMM|nr:signal peptidase II [Methylomonas koyamae]OAI17880.1 signal peptidase II [Methylomonas koyamae]